MHYNSFRDGNIELNNSEPFKSTLNIFDFGKNPPNG